MPSGLIEQQDGMRAPRDVKGNFLQMHAHSRAVAFAHDDAGTLALRAGQMHRTAMLMPAADPWMRWGGYSAWRQRTPGGLGLLATQASSCHHSSTGVPLGSRRLICPDAPLSSF